MLILELIIILFVINYLIFCIYTNAKSYYKIFSDVVSFNSLNLWTAKFIYRIICGHISYYIILINLSVVVLTGWFGFFLDYYSQEFNLIRYYWTFDKIILILNLCSLLYIILNIPFTFNIFYFLVLFLFSFITIFKFYYYYIDTKLNVIYP